MHTRATNIRHHLDETSRLLCVFENPFAVTLHKTQIEVWCSSPVVGGNRPGELPEPFEVTPCRLPVYMLLPGLDEGGERAQLQWDLQPIPFTFSGRAGEPRTPVTVCFNAITIIHQFPSFMPCLIHGLEFMVAHARTHAHAARKRYSVETIKMQFRQWLYGSI